MKNSNTIKEKIVRRRIDRLDRLRACCVEASKLAAATIKKIDDHELSASHSCNHDILKWAERVHRISYELWLLNDLQSMTGVTNDVTTVLVEEDTGDKENESV